MPLQKIDEKKPVTTKGNTVKEEKENQKITKIFKPVLDKKEGFKKELAINQLDDALGRTKNIDKISKKGLKNVVDAAADDSQLKRSKRRIMRMLSESPPEFKKAGGRAGYKMGKSVKKKSSRKALRGGGCEIR